jgi:hypothetical protein
MLMWWPPRREDVLFFKAQKAIQNAQDTNNISEEESLQLQSEFRNVIHSNVSRSVDDIIKILQEKYEWRVAIASIIGHIKSSIAVTITVDVSCINSNLN